KVRVVMDEFYTASPKARNRPNDSGPPPSIPQRLPPPVMGRTRLGAVESAREPRPQLRLSRLVEPTVDPTPSTTAVFARSTVSSVSWIRARSRGEHPVARTRRMRGGARTGDGGIEIATSTPPRTAKHSVSMKRPAGAHARSFVHRPD